MPRRHRAIRRRGLRRRIACPTPGTGVDASRSAGRRVDRQRHAHRGRDEDGLDVAITGSASGDDHVVGARGAAQRVDDGRHDGIGRGRPPETLEQSTDGGLGGLGVGRGTELGAFDDDLRQGDDDARARARSSRPVSRARRRWPAGRPRPGRTCRRRRWPGPRATYRGVGPEAQDRRLIVAPRQRRMAALGAVLRPAWPSASSEAQSLDGGSCDCHDRPAAATGSTDRAVATRERAVWRSSAQHR